MSLVTLTEQIQLWVQETGAEVGGGSVDASSEELGKIEWGDSRNRAQSQGRLFWFIFKLGHLILEWSSKIQ